jgi:NAD-dependent dihydropyrimidine dehydrogenase PreA subunit
MMRNLRQRLVHFVLDILQTVFRMLPWPTPTGLRKVGHPGPASPVLVTGNYDLTVRRLLRDLQGLDAWVVVAPSQGVNVWCAAAGGHFGTHQVVTAIKTSGIEGRVEHRRAILPQLAGTGVVAQDVARRTGWRVKFGPVYARDLPSYLAAGQQASGAMRHVRFTLWERLEMMTAWAAPTSLVLAAVFGVFFPGWLLPLLALTWLLAAAVYFFVLEWIPGPRRLLLALISMFIASLYVFTAGGGTWAIAAAAGIALGLAWLLSFDYQGSTPNHAVDHFHEADFRIHLDTERCTGAFVCLEVCPEGVFEREENRKKVTLAHPEQCVRCAACIVQCPRDALYLEDGKNNRVTPETIRRFKLNLLGRRAIHTSGSNG